MEVINQNNLNTSQYSRITGITCSALMLLTMSGCGSSSDESGNITPKLNAGADIVVDEKSTVTLNAVTSDADGSIETVKWLQTAGTMVNLTSDIDLSTSFTAPDIKPTEVLTFIITVTDDKGSSATDLVNVTVNHINILPSLDAGGYQTMDAVSSLMLTGTGHDIDGSITYYQWEQTSGPAGTLTHSDTANPTFLSPEVTQDTEVEIKLTVTDDEGGKASETIVVLISEVTNLMTGQFIDSPVEGLTYSTESRVGITGQDGEFHYLENETVVFGLGDLTFPAVTAAHIITPLDLAGVNDINDTGVVNMARLLQTLDKDCNPDNGITIGGEVLLATTNMSINFSDPDFDSNVAQLFMDAAIVQNSCGTLVSAEDATAHFQETLDKLVGQENPPIAAGLQGKLGVWEGVGQQSGVSWTIKATLKEDEQLIEYPSLSCGGYLTLIEESDTQLLFKETITFGVSSCVDQGYVELTDQSESELVFRYYWPITSEGQDPRGSLGAVGTLIKIVD